MKKNISLILCLIISIYGICFFNYKNEPVDNKIVNSKESEMSFIVWDEENCNIRLAEQTKDINRDNAKAVASIEAYIKYLESKELERKN